MPAPLKRKHFYVLEKHYTDLAVRCLPTLAKTGLTPNQVTIANLINGLVIMAAIAAHQYLLAAILTQLYLFLDILDGNLARYREMSTRLGAILDKIGESACSGDKEGGKRSRTVVTNRHNPGEASIAIPTVPE